MRQPLTPWQDSPREPLEHVMRLAGRTTFLTPGMGRASSGIPDVFTSDMSVALLAAPDQLGAALAMAMACPSDADLEDIQNQASERIQKALCGTWRYGALVAGTKRYRIRLVLHHVLRELIYNLHIDMARAAREAHMRKANYTTLHHYIAAETEQWARTAARNACDYLFGVEDVRNRRATAAQ